MKRSLQLARVAAQAELLRWRRMARREAMRVVWAVVALVFLLACLTALHVALALLLRRWVEPLYAVLIVAGIDLVIGVILLVVAMRDSPDRIEREALQVREAAQAQMMEAAAMTTLVAPVLRSLGTRKLYGLALAALTARYLGGRR